MESFSLIFKFLQCSNLTIIYSIFTVLKNWKKNEFNSKYSCTESFFKKYSSEDELFIFLSEAIFKPMQFILPVVIFKASLNQWAPTNRGIQPRIRRLSILVEVHDNGSNVQPRWVRMSAIVGVDRRSPLITRIWQVCT